MVTYPHSTSNGFSRRIMRRNNRNGADAHVVIPDAVSIIDDFTFEACMNLGEITIPRSVTSIGAYALGGCMRLRNIFYSGRAEERDRIQISASNKTLPFATWRCTAQHS